jgi:hypothetical protein
MIGTLLNHFSMPSVNMKDSLPPVDSKIVLKYSFALLLAVRCKQKEATTQLLARIYHLFSEEQAKITMNRLIYLLEPAERDWMKSLV